MKLNHISLTISLLAPLGLVSPGVTASERHESGTGHEKRQHQAHVHGVAALNLALEGKEVHVELVSAAANIVGFEHAPKSEDDHVALDKAVAALKGGDQLFGFNSEAGCRMKDAKVASAMLDEGHKEHADESEYKKQDEQSHDRHEHEVHEKEGETHADIEAAYHFECDQPGRLTQLTVGLFDAFPGMEELDVQYVIESKQGAEELTPAAQVIRF